MRLALNSLNKLNTRSKQLLKFGITGLLLITIVAGYLAYQQLWATASVATDKLLTGNGVVSGAAGTTIMNSTTYSNTLTSNTSYFELREASDGVGTIAWEFDSWEQLNTSTEATGDKVTKVSITMDARMSSTGSTSTNGGKTFRFYMYNFNTLSYDLATVSTGSWYGASSDDVITLDFPTTDYTNYFDVNGNLRVKIIDVSDDDGSVITRLRIDYMYVRIYYDKTAPTATWSSPTGSPYYTNAANVTLTATGTDNSDAEASGIDHFDFYNNTDANLIGTTSSVSGNVYTGATGSITWVSPAEGTYNIYAKSTDDKNNVSDPTTTQTIVVDRTNPTATISTPLTDTSISGNSYAIRGTATDTVNMKDYKVEYYKVGTGPWTQIGSTQTGDVTTEGPLISWDTTSVSDAVYDLRLTVTDEAGNSQTTTINNVTVDNTPPALSLEYYSDSALTIPYGTVSGKPVVGSGTVYVKLVSDETLRNTVGDNQITIDAADTANDITNANFSWNGSAWVYPWLVSGGVSNDGDTTSITVKGTDSVGNITNGAPSSGGTVTVDTAIPTAVITAPADSALINGNYTITGSASDALALNYWQLEYYKTGSGPWTSIGTGTNTVTSNTLLNWDTTSTTDGEYQVRLTVFDKAYNTAVATVNNISLDNTGPDLSLQYYSDAGLTVPLATYNDKPIAKAGTVYVKLVSGETLRSNANDNQISIDLPDTENDISNADFSWNGSAWVYAWTVPNTNADADMTVKGTSLLGNVTSGVPTSGVTVTVDNSVNAPTLAATGGPEQATLTFTGDGDYKDYYVYRSTTGSFTADASTLVETVVGPTGSYIDHPGVGIYYYKIKAVDLAGNISGVSNEVSVTTIKSIKSAFLKYSNNGSYVAISVYFDDTGGGGVVQWANDMMADGSQLNWQNLTVEGAGTTSAYASLTNAEKYKNYYLQLTKGSEVNNIRAFPVDFDTVAGPRYQNDYAHGNYEGNTGMCAGCHSTHGSLKGQLLKQATYYELCLLCHGTAATQSKYDVQSGMVKTSDGWKNSLAGPIGTDYGISKHNVDDRSSVTTEVYGSAPGKTLTFTCNSCHKPHGGTKDNYRLLRETIYPANDKFASTTVAYTAYAVVKDQTVGEEVYMVSGNSEFCAACHMDYVKGTAKVSDGVYQSFYRHPVTVGSIVYGVYQSSPLRDWYPTTGDNLPLQVNNGGESIGSDKRTAVVCSTCHYAHGSYKNFVMGYPQANGAPRENVTNAKMLRLDNYGVCESCHKK